MQHLWATTMSAYDLRHLAFVPRLGVLESCGLALLENEALHPDKTQRPCRFLSKWGNPPPKKRNKWLAC